MRAILVAVLVVASPALAQAISGTIGGAFERFQGGVPEVRVNVVLGCSLTCDASAPTKHFVIRDGLSSSFDAAPSEASGYSSFLSTDLDLDGEASVVTASFKAGSVNRLEAKSASCHCGNRVGEGGFVNLASLAPIVVPPGLGEYTNPRVGYPLDVTVEASLRGAEQIEIKAEGAGVSQTKVVGAADFTSGYATMEVTPTATGPIVLTATMVTSGVASTKTVQILERLGGSGGGGGSSGTGGGSEPPTGGCSTTGGAGGLLALALLLARRR